MQYCIMDEETLEKMALEEIMKDIKRGAERAQKHGALGWQKNPVPPPNKTFLRNMIMSTLTDRTRTISCSTSKPHAITDRSLYVDKQQCVDHNSSRGDSFSDTRKARVGLSYSGRAPHRKQSLSQRSCNCDSHTSSNSCDCKRKVRDSSHKRPDDSDSAARDATSEASSSAGSRRLKHISNRRISYNENHMPQRDDKELEADGTRDRISGQDARTWKDSHSAQGDSKKHSDPNDTTKKHSKLGRHPEDSSKRKDDKTEDCSKHKKSKRC